MESTNTSQSANMENPSSSPFSAFKSKKILRSSSKPAPPSNQSDPNTPQKPMQLRHRTRNQRTAFSISEVKQIAKGLNKSPKIKRPDPLDLLQASPSAKRSKKKAIEAPPIPEKYETLAKTFDSMVCSIRLLRLKRTICSFSNISKTIESLNDRRFSYNQLAQMKSILPEAIVLKKDLMCDERTSCMRPYLQVNLEIDAIENDGKWKEGIGYTNMGKVFRSRILEFIEAHPEVDEIPEETLPEPFNQTKEKPVIKESSACSPSLISHTQQYSVAASHLSRAFQKRFTQRVPISESEKTPLLAAIEKPSSPAVPVSSSKEADFSEETSSVIPSRLKNPSTLPIIGKPAVPVSASKEVDLCEETSFVIPSRSKNSSTLPIIGKPGILSPSNVGLLPSSPLKIGHKVEKLMKKESSPKEILPLEGTPAKTVSTPARLLSITPDLQTPKRSRVSQDDDSISSPNKLVRRPPRNRPLFQTPVKNAKEEDERNKIENSSISADLLKLLPKSLVQSIREQEKRTAEGHDIAISEAKRRRQMIASLPKLFNMIHLMFGSDNRKIITKQELMHRIIASHIDIVDRAEFEQQLKLLLELAPDWISEKVASGGDHLLCVNKMSSPDAIRKRLVDAV